MGIADVPIPDVVEATPRNLQSSGTGSTDGGGGDDDDGMTLTQTRGAASAAAAAMAVVEMGASPPVPASGSSSFAFAAGAALVVADVALVFATVGVDFTAGQVRAYPELLCHQRRWLGSRLRHRGLPISQQQLNHDDRRDDASGQNT